MEGNSIQKEFEFLSNLVYRQKAQLAYFEEYTEFIWVIYDFRHPRKVAVYIV